MKRLIQNTMIIVLGAAIIVMSVGYAAFNTEISFASPNPNTANVWDVHFENPTKLNTTTILDENMTLPSLNDDTTSLNFSAKMLPLETYEFTVDVKNAGVLNAKLENFTLSAAQNGVEVPMIEEGIVDQSGYLQYSIKWETGENLSVGHELYRDNLRTLKITVTALESSSILKDSGAYVFSLNLNYVQK